MTSLLLPHLSSSLTDCLPSLNLLCHWKTDALFMQDSPSAVWSIPYVGSVAFFPSLLQNFIAYRSSKVSSRPDCIFEIHQLWQWGFNRVYSNWCCSCWFEPEIIKIGMSSHKMYSNNILNFHVSTTILDTCRKCLETYWIQHLMVRLNCSRWEMWSTCSLSLLPRMGIDLKIPFNISLQQRKKEFDDSKRLLDFTNTWEKEISSVIL